LRLFRRRQLLTLATYCAFNAGERTTFCAAVMLYAVVKLQALGKR